jgi:hypothetical protein
MMGRLAAVAGAVMVVRVTVRVVVLHSHREDVGKVALCDLLLEVLLDGVVELVKRKLVAAMVWVEQLFALLSRQIRRFRVASVNKRENCDELVRVPRQ